MIWKCATICSREGHASNFIGTIDRKCYCRSRESPEWRRKMWITSCLQHLRCRENPCCSSCLPSIWVMNTGCLPLSYLLESIDCETRWKACRSGVHACGVCLFHLSLEQKNEVYRQVRESEVDLFYLSPGCCSRMISKHFAGERRIAVWSVDEAHTVTTWGKEFRVDYWFLGRYLQGLKKSLGYAFPTFCTDGYGVWNRKEE